MKRVLVLVEGQTEERFVKDVLAPFFEERQLFFQPTLLVTKRVKDGTSFKGGVTSFAKFQNDARRLLQGSGGALVTTIVDYYGLPVDFPGMSGRSATATPAERAAHVEAAINEALGSPGNFLPFLALHEFEAWLFAAPEMLSRAMAQPGLEAALAAIRSQHAPEEINETPERAPSRRLLDLYPGYRKTLHGPAAAKRIGIERIRNECPHFNAWISALEEYAGA